MGEPDFWNNQAKAQAVSRQISDHKKITELWNDMDSQAEDLETLFEMAVEEDDRDAFDEIEAGVQSLRNLLEAATLQSMLSAPDDTKNAIVSIHPGAGGTESQDWAEMLMRMYLRWMESRNYAFDTLDLQPGDEAGIKSVSIEVSGEYAYGYLKAEAGVHRLVRISPFDANKRRHTSFASIFVYPEVDEIPNVEFRDDELQYETFRAGGAGGQHVNKTSSAVRLTHLPTGISVQCQNERSQFKNKATALKVLTARVYQHFKEEEAKKQEAVESTKKSIEFGSQIRSYVLHPYNLVKDHRTGHETGNVQAVMDGQLDDFIRAFLMEKSRLGSN